MTHRDDSSSSAAKIVISGWYGMDNPGDDAILQQFLEELADPTTASVTVLSERPDRVEACFGNRGVRALFHARLAGRGALGDLLSGRVFKQWALMRRASLFVLGGGGILRDNITRTNLVRQLDEVWMAKLLGIPVGVYAVGAGPYASRFGKWLVRRTMALCDLITVRDPISKQELESIGVPGSRILVVADPAILFEPRPVESGDARGRIERAAAAGAIGLFVEEDDTPVQALAEALDRLHAVHGFTFASVPMRCHQGRDDRMVAAEVQNAMRHPAALERIDATLTPAELKWAAAQFRMNLTVRLHALIFSISSGVPAVAIDYQPKIGNFLNSFDLDEWCVYPDRETTDKIVAKVLACDANLTAYAEHIRATLPERRWSARRTFDLLRALLTRERMPGAEPTPSACE